MHRLSYSPLLFMLSIGYQISVLTGEFKQNILSLKYFSNIQPSNFFFLKKKKRVTNYSCNFIKIIQKKTNYDIVKNM